MTLLDTQKETKNSNQPEAIIRENNKLDNVKIIKE